MSGAVLRWLLVMGLLVSLGILAIPVLEARDALLRAHGRIETEWRQVQQAMDARAATVTRLLALLDEPGRRAQLSPLPQNRQLLAAALRQVAMAADSPSVVQSNEQLQDLLHRLHPSTEASPTAEDAELQRMMAEIVAAENQIHQKRTQYNEAVQEYNVRLALFPANLAGKLFGLQRHELYLPTALPVGAAPGQPAR